MCIRDSYYVLPDEGKNNMKQLKIILVADNTGSLDTINELEFIDGYIYANRWQTDYIFKIDTSNGHVVGKMDLTGLLPILNFEFKAKTTELDNLEKKLLELNPKLIGEDNQTDTYFNVTTGRLKLREGNIENSLIYYERQNTAGAKQSDVLLYRHNPDKTLKDILIKLHGIKVIVEKIRKIY